MSVDDEELREAERVARSQRTLENRLGLARLLRRAGKMEELLDVLLPNAPRELQVVARSLGSRLDDRTLIVGTGQYSHLPGRDRVGVLDVTGTPALEWEGFIESARIAAFRDALRERNTVWPGELDFMAATEWELAWTTKPAPFACWDHQGELCAVADGVVRSRGREPIAARDIGAVEVWLANGWVTRGVSIVVRGQGLAIASQDDLMAAADPTYDGINLMCDAAWAVALGRSLATALGVACTLDEDLT